MKLKNKILAGILSGAMIFGGGVEINSAQAEPTVNEQQQEFGKRHKHSQMTEEQLNEHAKDIADYYELDQVEVLAALKNHVKYEDIKHAATLAKISGKSFTEVLAMKTDWKQVAEKLGVTREKIDNFMHNAMLEDFSQRSKLDKKTVENLLNDKYSPHDIIMAGIIANASGKSVKKVMAKRQINNTWDDVAKDFGVDLHKLIKPELDSKHEHRH